MSDSRIPFEPIKNNLASQVGDGSGAHQTAEQAGAAFWTIPGFNAPPPGLGTFANLPGLNDFTHTQTKSFSFGQEIIPTLKPGQAENELDQTVYNRDSPTAKILDNNRDSIVEIYGPPADRSIGGTLGASGFFLDDHGDIATAAHVLRDISVLHVFTADGVTHDAQIVSSDPSSDVAIISIGAAQHTQPVTLDAATDDLHAGDALTAIGHPHGWTAQYVSPGTYLGCAPLETLTQPQYFRGVSGKQTMLAADMNTQLGNSGSAVFNAAGQVVGLLSRGNGSHTSYLIPAASIKALADGKSGSASADINSGSVLPDRKNGSVSSDTIGAHTPAQPSFTLRPPAQPSFTLRPPAQPSFALPTEATSPSDSGLYLGAIIAASSRFFHDGYASKGYAARLGTTLSGIFGYEAFVAGDRKALVDAFSGGSSQDKIRSSIKVASDGLLVGAAVAGYIPSFSAASVGISLAGTALKIGNRVI